MSSEQMPPENEQITPEVHTQPLSAPESVPPEGLVEPIEAVVAGHICLDIIPTLTGEKIDFAPGRLIEVGKAILATGGPVSNTGLALHTLGVTTCLMGKVGNDLFGQAIIQLIRAHGADLANDMLIATGEESSYSVIISPPGTDRIILHAPGANDTFQASDVDYELLRTARLFHFGYPPLMACMYRKDGAELAAMFRQSKAAGVTTSLDLSMPGTNSPAGRANWQTILAATLPYVDVFVPSVEELLLLLRRPLFDKLCATAKSASIIDYIPPDVVSELGAMLLEMGAKIVGLKLGHRGLYLCTADVATLGQMGQAQPTLLKLWAKRELWTPCFSTNVVGTTGSGDATIAGFLMGLLRGMTPEATLAAATAVGACNVEAADALSGIRSWPETMERIAAGWPRLLLEKKGLRTLEMSAFGWQWDHTHEVWLGPMNV